MTTDRDEPASSIDDTSMSPALPIGPIGTQTTLLKDPGVIGIYGVPGCGKSFLLNNLKKKMAKEPFAFYDGSEMIESVVPGGFSAFLVSDEHEKMKWRQAAIEKIREECVQSGRTGVVAGHLIFWEE